MTEFSGVEADYTLLGTIEPSSKFGKVLESTKKELPNTIFKMNKNFVNLMVGSLGFVAALSWNDFFKSLFEKGGIFEKVGNSGLLLTAIFVTFVAFLATVFATSLYPEDKVEGKKNPIKI